MYRTGAFLEFSGMCRESNSLIGFCGVWKKLQKIPQKNSAAAATAAELSVPSA
jgi:hypothetical protein